MKPAAASAHVDRLPGWGTNVVHEPGRDEPYGILETGDMCDVSRPSSDGGLSYVRTMGAEAECGGKIQTPVYWRPCIS